MRLKTARETFTQRSFDRKSPPTHWTSCHAVGVTTLASSAARGHVDRGARERDEQLLLQVIRHPLESRHATNWQKRDVAGANAVVPCGQGMAELVEHDDRKRGEDEDDARPGVGQVVALQVVAHRDPGKQDQKRPVHVDVDSATRPSFHDHPVMCVASPSEHAEMPKRLFDRLTLFGRARLDVTTAAGPVRFTQRRYAVNLLDMRDPSRLRDEAVVTLHELAESRCPWPFHVLRDRPYQHEGHYDAGVTDCATGVAERMPSSSRISRRLTTSTRTR